MCTSYAYVYVQICTYCVQKYVFTKRCMYAVCLHTYMHAYIYLHTSTDRDKHGEMHCQAREAAAEALRRDISRAQVYHLGVSENKGYLIWGPCNKAPTI